ADRDRSQAGSHQGQADPRVTPEDLLEGDRGSQTGGLEPLAAEEIERIQADLGRLFDDRPGRLFAFVPFGGCGPHHVLGELMHPGPHLPDVIGHVEGEGAGAAADCLLTITHLENSLPRRLSYSAVVCRRKGPSGQMSSFQSRHSRHRGAGTAWITAATT